MSGNEDLVALFRQLGEAQFWGSLEIKFEAGNVVLLKKTETSRARPARSRTS